VSASRREWIAPLLLSIAATVWTGFVGGPGLAIYLGAPLLACFYVPFVTLGMRSFDRAIAVSAGIAAVLLAFNIRADVTLVEWFRCVVVITSLVIALTGIASFLAWIRIVPVIAATITSIIAITWMTWPIWLSHGLTQTRVNALVWPHPLLAINGVLEHLGAWDHAPIAYRYLTILNQDIPFELPTSILPATIIHLMLGVPLLLSLLRKKTDSPVEPPAIELPST
jgi:hypothetical protein